jgi:hypothetical protein
MVHTEWILRVIDGHRLTADQSLMLAVTLIGYVRGVAVNIEAEARAEEDTGLTNMEHIAAQNDEFHATLAGSEFPMLAQLNTSPHIDLSLDRLFEFGLARMLDGFAALLESADSPS